MRSVGDRRNGVRFEVVGPFWGTFDTTAPSTRLLDLSECGALFEAHLPLAVASVHSLCLDVDGVLTSTEAQVRHVSPAHSGSQEVFRMGVEFLESSTSFLDAVEQLLRSRAMER